MEIWINNKYIFFKNCINKFCPKFAYLKRTETVRQQEINCKNLIVTAKKGRVSCVVSVPSQILRLSPKLSVYLSSRKPECILSPPPPALGILSVAS